MTAENSDLQSIIRANYELGQIQDIDILLERILFMARRVVGADAGSIYEKREVEEDGEKTDKLFIKHAQNDTLQKSLAPGEKQIYSRFYVPINDSSVSGYCAGSRRAVNIPDMYDIPKSAPYSFNSSFDKISGYKTVSTLTLPLAVEERLLGVIQVINKTDESGSAAPFSLDDELVLTNFAVSATAAMQRALLTRSMILRMIKMAELRDPAETGTHVNRVADYSVEIYDRWAHANSVPDDKRERERDILRIGAMLHDVGKVAISDTILKKPGRLSPDEFATMQKHTVYGAGLFQDSLSEVDKVAIDIAHTHHENWDGTGYPAGSTPSTRR
jgi:HD-GYP domain-containing protein (c-di-GMP phosphodiesterase class II)